MNNVKYYKIKGERENLKKLIERLSSPNTLQRNIKIFLNAFKNLKIKTN